MGTGTAQCGGDSTGGSRVPGHILMPWVLGYMPLGAMLRFICVSLLHELFDWWADRVVYNMLYI